VQEQRETIESVDKRLQEARAALKADDYPTAIKAVTGLSTQLRAALKALESSPPPAAPRRRR
jgi:hypothetical protein